MKKTLVFSSILLMGLTFNGLAHPLASTSVVNINNATVTELVSLKGIGDKKAAAIVAYRKLHGNFKSADELAKVRGISSKMLDKIEKENPGKITFKAATPRGN